MSLALTDPVIERERQRDGGREGGRGGVSTEQL